MNPIARRTLLALTASLPLAQPPAHASPPLAEGVEQANSLDQLAQLLGARDALASTHLLLGLPDVALPGPVAVTLRSELPGTSLLLLARGRFTAGPGAQATSPMGAPSVAVRRHVGEYTPKDRLARPVWLATLPFAAGQPASAQLSIPIETPQSLTLFAHAQGRWWFVTREVKLGRPKAQR